METTRKNLIETSGINDQSISSQSMPREVSIKVSIEDYNHCYKELYVATNTEKLMDRIKIWEGYNEDDIDYLYNEIMICSFPMSDNDNDPIDDYILSYISCYITECELETRMTREDGDERILMKFNIHTHHESRTSASIM